LAIFLEDRSKLQTDEAVMDDNFGYSDKLDFDLEESGPENEEEQEKEKEEGGEEAQGDGDVRKGK